ncbi:MULTISPECIES: lipopolysaccharide biosynthesis protein [Bacillus]|uniref:lipopolysaccharide biosynthesis protein n=1 Tax=Bacillus TaxID=1386 RepID=UPI001E5355C9|nr:MULTISPECIES: polysaccharide biosynthesis C-terminal domain-containing protein [Bacillus cereus group]MCC2412734.1 polysaccharide biosynthesis C-terminal domain-containing protein [Bacillus paranthracis]MDA1896228.1 polysaccharide biosynthesis C-terminal domain-containing protein [Bacillus cereus group sp. BcHK28]HDR7894659.1 polysaccharide biosynthesis C-terminal domain-containing protein [Bacillus pacificus]
MRTQKAFYNFLGAILLQVITIVLGFMLVPIRIKTYGSEMNGLIASLGQFLAYFKLVEAGIGVATMQALYKPLANKDQLKINGILSATRSFYHRSGLVFMAIIVIFAMLYPFVTESEIPSFTIFILIIVLAGSGVLEFLVYNKYAVLLAADQKEYIVNITQVIISILNAVIAIALMYWKQDIIIVTIWSTSASFLRMFIIIRYFKRKYPAVKFNTEADYKAIDKRWDAFIHQIASLIVFNSPIVIITIFLGLKMVSVYSVYGLIFTAIGSMIGVFSTGLLAGFGEAIAMNNKDNVRRAYSSFECLYYMVLTWAYTCCLILVIPFMKMYTEGINDANYINPILAILFVGVGLANQIRIPQNIIVSAAGHFKETRKRAIIEAIINVIASLVFVQYYGIYGVLLGSICSFLYRTIDFIIYSNVKILEQSSWKSIRRISVNLIMGSIVFLVFNFLFPINVSSWKAWILQAIVVSIWTLVIILSGNFIFERVIILDIFSRIRTVLKNIKNRKIINKI